VLNPVFAREDQLALLVEPGSQPTLHRLDDEPEVRPEIRIDPFPAFVGPEPILALRSGARLARAALYGATFLENDLIFVQIDQIGEARMGDRALVALKEIHDHDPVGLDRIFPPLAKLKRVNVGAR
jgi:hypothetical protein